MKIVLNSNIPFALAHGGMEVQIEQTRAALQRLGLQAEPLRWWDGSQRADILHHFSALPSYLIRMAQDKGIRVVQSALIGGLGAKPRWRRSVQRVARGIVRKVSPPAICDSLGWDAFRIGDACLALTDWEAHLLKTMYNVEPSRLHVVPNGVEQVFFDSPPATRGKWLVCTATIVELKQVLKLAQSAVAAKTPLWVIGKPFSATDPYAIEFERYARSNSSLVRYQGPIMDRAQLARVYREARGFVLLSKWESLSLSALEASACECRLLLSDLPWARTVFGSAASYCKIDASVATTSDCLKNFYESAPNLPLPPKPLTWLEVAENLKRVYEGLLK
jgi:glycosyltransferase involved in cell wall biosynthesis